MRVRPLLGAVALATVLAACGSGGSDAGGGADAAPLPGLDPYLDRLLAQCEADDTESCARLILEDDDGVYAERALVALGGGSAAVAAGDDAGADDAGTGDPRTAERLAECEAGDVDVCTELYLEAPVGSELEQRALDAIIGAAPGGDFAGDLGGSIDAEPVDPDAEAFFGDVALDSGFTPDPYLLEMTAGGNSDASELGGRCTGAIGSQPDIRLEFEAGVLPLNVYAYPDFDEFEDLTLVVRDPTGRYRCDDDYDGLSPAVLIDRPVTGTYEIWVGVWGDPGALADAVLAISELDPAFP